MTAGALDRRVAFKQFTTVSDGAGGEDRAAATQFERWARFRAISLSAQGEQVRAGELAALSRAVLEVRDDPETRTIAADWIVEVDGRDWDIREAIRDTTYSVMRMTIVTGDAI